MKTVHLIDFHSYFKLHMKRIWTQVLRLALVITYFLLIRRSETNGQLRPVGGWVRTLRPYGPVKWGA